MQNKTPYLIGLAGQSCAGKNAAAAFLAKRGFYIIDADAVTQKLLHSLQDELIQRYQQQAVEKELSIIKENGSLNTRALGALLFADAELLAAHEAYIIPKIEARISEEIQILFQTAPDTPIVLNAPTLHKTSFTAQCAFIFYIEAPYLVRLWRAKKRDNIPLRIITARFSNQKNFLSQYLLQNADIQRVKNAGSVVSLENKIAQVLLKKGI